MDIQGEERNNEFGGELIEGGVGCALGGGFDLRSAVEAAAAFSQVPTCTVDQ